MKTGMILGLMASTALAVASGPAQAQEAAAVPGGDELGQPDEIVVTASKRVERLQDIPFAITAIDAESLLKRGETRLEDFLARAPGVNLTNSAAGGGQSSVSIRGVTTGQGGNPTVAVYINDIPFNSQTMGGAGTFIPDLDPSDLQSIEILRGPQGTLYGAGSMGGLIRYVTKDADFENLSGRIQIDGSKVSSGGEGYGIRGGINLPLSEKVALRASAFVREDPGFIDDQVRGRENRNRSLYNGGRISLAIKPVDDVTVQLSALRQKILVRGNAVLDYSNATRDPLYPDLQTPRVPGTDASRFALNLYDMRVEADLGPVNLISVTSYSDRNLRSHVDYTSAIAPLLAALGVTNPGGDVSTRVTSEKFTQELRLTSTGKNMVEWQVGGFYTHETNRQRQMLAAVDATTGGPVNVVVPDLLTADLPASYEEIAAFGDLTLHLSPKFDITGGIRYSRSNQDSTQTTSGLLAGASSYSSSASDDQITYLGNLRYHLTDNVMLYGRVATGYRPGGPNLAVSGGLATYASDSLINYEIGVKADALDRRLTLDLAAFYIDWSSIQLRGVNAATGTNYYSNGGKAKSQGFEGTISFRPTSGLSLNGNLAYTDASLTRALTGALIGADGDRLPGTPKWAAQAGADYVFDVDDNWQASVGANYRYVGSRLSDFENSAAISRFNLPAYDTVNLHAGVQRNGLSIDLFIRNLGDTRGLVSASRLGQIQRVAIIQPRAFGISVAQGF